MEEQIMKKILFALFTLSALSCVKEQPMNNPQDMAADVRQVVLCASNEAQTKTFFNKDNGTITWNTTEEPLAIFDGALRQFTCSEVSQDKTLAYFTGSADFAQTSWIAVYPYSHASVVNSELVVKIPSFQTARAKGGINQGENTSAAIVSVVNDEPQGFTMMNVGGLLKFTVSETGIKTITFSTIGGEPLTGNVKLSFEDGKPKATVLDGETFVTLMAADMTNGFAPGDYFACVLPVNLSQGIRIDMEKIDGKTASVAAKTPAEVLRSGDLEFAGVDTGASWYMPELSTIELDFKEGPWPFTQQYYPGVTDAAAWKKTEDEKEKLMTLKTDNSILFYMSCSDYCSAGGANGLRFGKAAGDYMLFPAIPGKSLKKVAVTFLKEDITKAAIRTRSGCADVIGGAAAGNQDAGATFEYNLTGTARNMQYRYELTGNNAATQISKIVLTYASKGTPGTGNDDEAQKLVIDVKFWEGTSYEVQGSVVQPFTDDLPGSNTAVDNTYTLKDTEYTFDIKATVRLCATSTCRGLRICNANDYIKLPVIENMRLVGVESVVGGLADNTKPEPYPVPERKLCLSTTTSKDDAVLTMTAQQCTLTEPSTFSASFDEMDNDEYYLVTVSANIALRNLRLTYAPVGESAQVAAGMLQAGDQAEI